MKNVCLIDLKLSGHHPYYLATFAQTFVELGCNTYVLVADIEEAKQKLSLALHRFQADKVTFLESSAGQLNKRKWGCRSFPKLIRLHEELTQFEAEHQINFDLAFFAFLDDFSQTDLVLPYLFTDPFPRTFSGLLVAPRERLLDQRFGGLSFAVCSWLQRARKHFSTLGVLTEDVQDQCANLLNKHVTAYPDFCSQEDHESVASSLLEDTLQRAKGRKIVSLLGSMTQHKSIDLLFRCIEVANPQEYFFLIAGKFAPGRFDKESWAQTKQLISEERENMLVFDGWIESEAEFDALIDASSLLFAFYRGFDRSSNVLTKSARHRTPAIVSDQFLMGDRVRNHQLGFAVDEKGAVELFAKQSKFEWHYDEKLLEDFLSHHDESRLTQIFSELLGGLDSD